FLAFDLSIVEEAARRRASSAIGIGLLCILPAVFIIMRQVRKLAARDRRQAARLEAKIGELQSEIKVREETELALRESQERYELAADGANDGLWDWDLRTDEVYYSSRWRTSLGYAADEVADTPEAWLGLVHEADRETLETKIDLHLQGASPHFEDTYRILAKNGGYRWMLCRGLAVRSDQGEATRMAGSQTDVTKNKLAEEKLRHDAVHDNLTGLPNRSLFMDRLAHSINRAQRDPEFLFAVLFLDLDRFKVINDSLGHVVGDRLLQEVSRRLQSCLRIGDTVARMTESTIARLGGDEFAILLEDVGDATDVSRVAERIQEQLRGVFVLDKNEVFTSASIGITLSSTGYEKAEELLRDADAAMYRAKALGRSRHELFDQELLADATRRMQLEGALRRAVARRDLQVYYQAMVEIESGTVRGFEALLRWHHPEHGFVSPAEFVPIAEEIGLIAEIGEWVLVKACTQMKEWLDRCFGDSHGFMSVNLSGMQFLFTNVVEMVREILARTGLPANALKLEITEGVIIHNTDSVRGALGELKELGVELSIDDFGTGYSSLSYLHQLPFDVLKIDRSFISKLEAEGDQYLLVRGICALAHSLGLRVTAEGVETEEQLEVLRKLDCELAQGFLFSRPVPAAEAEKLIEAVPTL
ncbi:MAG: putative bifunctional diguanylate cyclase/phosphodiesterase, partial [Planctomycetota bacterium]